MRILALDSAMARCSATIVVGAAVVAGLQQDLERDHASVLPVMVRDVLRQAHLTAGQLDAVAVTVGPGSFTGIRAGLALAHGLGLAVGRTVVGVTVGEALRHALPDLGGRMAWCAIPSRRGRIFLDLGGQIPSLAVADIPLPDAPVALAGPAALDVAARLAAKGADVLLTDVILPEGRFIAAAARLRLEGRLSPLPAEPLYIDPPEARPRPETVGPHQHDDDSCDNG
ncbi:MAG TPA: tRNA (adenosine(37)-N6)-threonylcarbamoyltransferase complex dimerization subunit type 1 TsaB [Rhodopila sp.]|nr:tRNA (adenosine(37)-N6)-threonylcarbamoyltransferase complex dimerization subunit type 1 TsaB [Rhodopila sp.]